MQANYFGGHRNGQSEELSGARPNRHLNGDGRGAYVLMTTWERDGRTLEADYRHEDMPDAQFRAAQQRQHVPRDGVVATQID